MKFTLKTQKSLPISLSKNGKISPEKNALLQRLLLVREGCEKIEKVCLNKQALLGGFYVYLSTTVCVSSVPLEGGGVLLTKK